MQAEPRQVEVGIAFGETSAIRREKQGKMCIRDSRYLAYELLDETQHLICKKAALFEKPKHCTWKKPEIQVSFQEKEGKTAIIVCADTFVKGLSLIHI